MQILVNGEPYDAPDALTVVGLIERLGLKAQRLAVELDGEIVARSRWPLTSLQAGHRVEIVRAIGGG